MKTVKRKQYFLFLFDLLPQPLFFTIRHNVESGRIDHSVPTLSYLLHSHPQVQKIAEITMISGVEILSLVTVALN